MTGAGDLVTVRAGRLYDGLGEAARVDQAVLIRAGRIEAVLPWADVPDVPCLAEADLVTAGLVDLQINGAGGVLFNDHPDVAGLARMAEGARRGGTCWFLPTFITDAGTRYQAAIAAVRAGMGKVPGVIGLHLEGPFLSPKRPGIHPAEAVRAMTPEDEAALIAADMPLLLTLAPEEVGPEALSRLASAGVTVFAGHSEASYDDLVAAGDVLTGVTHLFNAMSQMQGRAPNMVGSVLGSDRLFAGIIADGIHVHPANLRAAFHALGPDRLFLVTDAMSPLGTDLDSFDLLGKRILRQGGRLADEAGTLAGADIDMAGCLKGIMAHTGASLGTAVRMASLTPARAMGLEGSIGSIAPGRRAGLSLFTSDLTVRGVVIDGVLQSH